ncbi:MAG: hypothetical protein RL571_1376 [Pseudomonadota bacterium]|jgi:hypothetical protein
MAAMLKDLVGINIKELLRKLYGCEIAIEECPLRRDYRVFDATLYHCWARSYWFYERFITKSYQIAVFDAILRKSIKNDRAHAKRYGRTLRFGV